jgi:hypothetical protein
MTKRKALNIINVMIADYVGKKINVDRYRWTKEQKDMGRRLMQENIDALRMARKALQQ